MFIIDQMQLYPLMKNFIAFFDELLWKFIFLVGMFAYRSIIGNSFCRCRHENIMHCHSVFFADHDLHIVLPRFYVLNDLIELYRERYNADPIPVAIIARILRQLCLGLQFLHKIGIMHRYFSFLAIHSKHFQ